MNFVEVAVKSAWWSKINWVQAITLVATIATVFGFDFSPELQAKIVETLVAFSALATIILRTWFTTSVTEAAAKRADL